MDSMITKPYGGGRLGAPAERPFVGRGHERRLLDGLVASVECGGAAALVAGEAGIGKTAREAVGSSGSYGGFHDVACAPAAR
jgi:hypothetical protein